MKSKKKPNPEIIKCLFKAAWLLFATLATDQNPIPSIRPPRGLLKVVTVVREARKNSTGSPSVLKENVDFFQELIDSLEKEAVKLFSFTTVVNSCQHVFSSQHQLF